MDPTAPLDPTTRQAFANGLLSPFTGGYVNPQFTTPDQLKAMRSAGVALGAQQQVHRPMEGVANIVRALVGGNMAFNADRVGMAAYANDLGAAGRVAATARGLTGDGASPSPAASEAPSTDTSSAPLPYTPASNGTGTAPTNDVGTSAMAFFQGKGLSPVAAAGLAGGFANEGTPTSVAAGDGSDGSNSIGIAQWNGPRAQALQQFAAKNGMDPTALRTQLEFSWNELNGPEKGTLNALQSAKSPLEAAAAAAGYERPAGWTLDNPTGASHFDRRLASTNALLGNGGGATAAIDAAAPQSAGAGPATMPAAATAFTGSAPMLTATAPSNNYPAGASTKPLQYAQALLNPAPAASGGASPADISRTLMSPYGTADSRAVARSLVEPTILTDSFGGSNAYRPGDPAARNVLRGTHFGAIGTPDANVETMTSDGPGGPGPTRLTVPPASPATPSRGTTPGTTTPGETAPPQTAGPLGGIAPIVHDAQRMHAEGTALTNETTNDVATLSGYKNDGVKAAASVAQLNDIAALGAKAGYGVVPNVTGLLGRYGIDAGGLGDIQGFQKAVDAFGANDPSAAAFRGALPTMLTTPQGRQAAVDNLRALAQRRALVGSIAGNEDLSPRDRMATIQALPSPQLTLPQPDGASAGTSAGGTPPATPDSLGPWRKYVPGRGAPSEVGGPSQYAGRFTSNDDALAQARAAIAAGKPREAVVQRLQAAGIDPGRL